MTLGIIDVGTNTIHLLIGVLGLNGKFHVILKERDLTRLGEGGLAQGRLTGASMRRATEVLRRYAAIMQRCGVDRVEAVATSAVRESRNGRAFVREIRRRLRLPLRIISGREEARLIYLGVLQQYRFRWPVVIISIGGGSTQVICGDGARARYLASVQLGGSRLAQRFIRHDPPRTEDVEALGAHVQRTWAPVVRALRRQRWRQALGSSATVYQLSLAAYLHQHEQPPKAKAHLRVSRHALRRLVERLASSTALQRMQLPGVDPRREDLLLPTGVALLALMEACAIRHVRYEPGSLREGLVMDYLIKHHQRLGRSIEGPLAELFGANGHELSLPWRKRLRRRLQRTHRTVA